MQKTALVTGGSKRIGRAICEGLAQAGYKIAIHYNNSGGEAEALADEINKDGGCAIAVQADLTNSQETRGLIDQASEKVGSLGILVNNASLFEEDRIDGIDDDLWDKHFQIHVKAPALLSSAFANQDIEEGLIVNVIDERVWKLTPKFSSYTLSKSALWTATQTMAQALAPAIRVNAIGPGPSLPSHRQTQQDFDQQVDSLLLRRAPELREFADTILYFAKARSVTGQMIALDGGQHLAWQTPDQNGPE